MTNLEILIKYLEKQGEKNFSSLILDNYNIQGKNHYKYKDTTFYLYKRDSIYNQLYDKLYNLYDEKLYDIFDDFEGNASKFFDLNSYICKIIPEITTKNLSIINNILEIFILDIIEETFICTK